MKWGAIETLPYTAVLITDGNSLVRATPENTCMPSFLVVELLGGCTEEKHVCVYQGVSPVARLAKTPPAMQKTQELGVQSLGWEDLTEEEIGSPLQQSCLKNPMDRGAWRAFTKRLNKNLHSSVIHSIFILEATYLSINNGIDMKMFSDHKLLYRSKTN